MNHNHIKPNMAPLPDPKYGSRPGYDASARHMDQLQIVEPVKSETVSHWTRSLWVNKVIKKVLSKSQDG